MSDLAAPSSSSQVVQPLPVAQPLSMDGISSQPTTGHSRKHSISGLPRTDRPSSTDSPSASLSIDDSGHHGHPRNLAESITATPDKDDARIRARADRSDSERDRSRDERDRSRDERVSEQEQQERDREQALRDAHERKLRDADDHKARDVDESRRSTTKETEEGGRIYDTSHSGSDTHRRHERIRSSTSSSTENGSAPSTSKDSVRPPAATPAPKVQPQQPPPQVVVAAPKVAAPTNAYVIGGEVANNRRYQVLGY